MPAGWLGGTASVHVRMRVSYTRCGRFCTAFLGFHAVPSRAGDRALRMCAWPKRRPTHPRIADLALVPVPSSARPTAWLRLEPGGNAMACG